MKRKKLVLSIAEESFVLTIKRVTFLPAGRFSTICPILKSLRKMNKLKALFASVFITFNALGVIYAVIQIFTSPLILIWIAAFVSLGIGAYFFSIIMLRHTPTTSTYLTPYLVINLIATILVVILYFLGGSKLPSYLLQCLL